MQEIFKNLDFLGFPNYVVSNLGYVQNIKTLRILKMKEEKNGYLSLNLSYNNTVKKFKIHKLVALAFIPIPQELKNCNLQINHIDENKLNNYVTNLEWVTSSININHGTRNERTKNVLTNRVDESKPIYMLDKNTKEILGAFPSISEAARYVNGDKSGISSVLRGKRPSIYGFGWKYA